MKFKIILGHILVWIAYIAAFLVLMSLLPSVTGIVKKYGQESGAYATGYLMGTVIGYLIIGGIFYLIYRWGCKLKKTEKTDDQINIGF